MKTLRSTLTLVMLGGMAVAAPALAQSAGSSGGGQSASVLAPAAPRPAPSRGFEPGNFPLPIVPGFSDGREWRDGAGPTRPGRPGKPDRPRRRDFYGYGYGIGFGGTIDGADRGYFATGGEPPAVRNRHVDYDYDRGYPYDHYSGRPEREVAYGRASREAYCETEWTRDRRSGQQVPVRVCRN